MLLLSIGVTAMIVITLTITITVRVERRRRRSSDRCVEAREPVHPTRAVAHARRRHRHAGGVGAGAQRRGSLGGKPLRPPVALRVNW